MPRAKTKEDLLSDYKIQYKKLMDMINSFSEEEQNNNFAFEDRDKNLRDVLIHLHEWHNMMLKWYEDGSIKGIKPALPREGYTWKTTAEMNKMIWSLYQSTSLTDAKKLLDKTHNELVSIISSLSEDQLYMKSFYKWTGTTTLGQYLVSAGPSHYDWAIKKLKLYKKELGK